MSSPKVVPLRDIRHPRPAGELLSLEQACQRLGARWRYIYAACDLGWLRTVMVGRRQKYLSWEVDALAGWALSQPGGLMGALNSGAAPPGAKGRYPWRWQLCA